MKGEHSGIDIGIMNIRYLGSIENFEDMGIKTDITSKLSGVIFGEEGKRIYQPLGLWADGEVLIFTEPVLRTVIKVDLVNKTFSSESGLYYPVDCVRAWGKIFISDSEAGQVFVFNENLKFLDSVDIGFERPVGLCFSKKSRILFVVDSGAHVVHSYSENLKKIFSLGKRGTGDGEFNFPTFCHVDEDDILYVVDSMNFRVQYFNSSDGKFLGKFGCHGLISGCFANPKGISVDRDGNIYVVDSIFDIVQIFRKDGTLLAILGKRGREKGELLHPEDIHIDPSGKIYVANLYNNRIEVFVYYPEKEDEGK